MISPFEIQKKLNQVSCPVCSDAKFKIERVEGNPDEAHFNAVCQRCDLKMKVVVIPPGVIRGLESMAPPEERRSLESVCPFCNGVGATFDFLCHLPSGTDYYVVTCTHCGQPYKEAAAPQR
jgi:transcription elongation factor Elf1